jgi:hypothetical protein
VPTEKRETPRTPEAPIPEFIPPMKVTPEMPCPCGSKKLVRECCLDADGNLRVKVPSLTPIAPPTGYAHPKCYLSYTLDCSDKISGEHYVSRSILEAMGEDVEVFGLPWQQRGAASKYGINSLVSNILCVRHNSAMSPLDALACQAFKTVKALSDDLSRQSDTSAVTWHLASGEALELWCLKTLCGLYFSTVAAKDGNSLKPSYSLDVCAFEEAIRLRRLPPNCGLYGRLVTGQFKTQISWAPLTVEHATRVIGLRLRMCAAEFEVFLEPFNVNFDVVRTQAVFRPWNLIFSDGKRMHVVVLSWPDKPQEGRTINYGIRPTLLPL